MATLVGDCEWRSAITVLQSKEPAFDSDALLYFVFMSAVETRLDADDDHDGDDDDDDYDNDDDDYNVEMFMLQDTAHCDFSS